ncbi:MAG: SGNH/GDSL hydrolase family protein [Acidimicrobiales bacterium]
MRRSLVITAAVVLAPVLVLGVQVQVARTGDRLDDEIGFRPTDLTVRPGDEPIGVVWLGDSTASGVGTDEVGSSMAYRVTETVTTGPATLSILGVSGAQVHEVLDDQLDQLTERVADGLVPDLVFISIGANDVTALTRRPTFEDRYDSLVRRIVLTAPRAEIVLVGIPDMGTAPRIPVPLRQLAGVRAAQLDGVIADIADSHGLHHVDLAGRTSRTFSSDPDRYFAGDGFHPSADGHEVWADAVVDSIADDAG